MNAQPLVEKLLRFSSWKLLAATVVLSEIFTLLMNTINSYIWWGRLDADLFLIGAVDAFIVSGLVGGLLIYLLDILRIARNDLEAETAKITGITDAIDAGICILDEDFRILYQNRAHMADIGWQTGRICHEAIHGRSSVCDGCHAETALKTGRLSRSEKSKAVSGRTRYFDMTASPVLDKAGNVTSVVEIVRDVTEKKEIEDALRKSEQGLLMAQAIARMGSWEWDVATNGVSWSEEVYRIHGVNPDDFRPDYKAVTDAIVPEDLPVFLEAVENALTRDEPFELDYSLRRPDGDVVTVHTRGEVVFDKAGRPVRMFGTVYDVTERKRLETEARKLAVITQQAAEGIAVANLDGYLTYANNAWAAMHGYEPKELVGRHLGIFHTEEQLKTDVIPFNEILLSQGQHSGEVGHRRKDGSTFPTQMTSTVLKDDKGNVTGMFGFATDITERKLMEDALRQSIKDRDMLIKEINHRVKNNLSVITSLLRLQSRDIEDERAKALFAESEGRVRAMSMIHERLYKSDDLRAINFGEYLRSLSEQVLKTYAVDNRRIRLRTEIEDLRVDVDAMIPCGLIVNELISNCVKYAFPDGREGEISVGFKGAGKNKFLLTVGDNGIGLPQELDIAGAKSMGMMIVEALSRQIGAEVTVERAGGTTVSIAFKEKSIIKK